MLCNLARLILSIMKGMGMCRPFDGPFDISDKEKEISLMEKIRKAASQINVDKDEYKEEIKSYLKFFDEEIKNYLPEKDYFLLAVYYSYLIPDMRITSPKVEAGDYTEKLKRWYDDKFDADKKNVFSLVPIALKSHKLDKPPQKYCLILSNKDRYVSLSKHRIEKIDISLCYKNSKLWNAWDEIIKEGTNAGFEKVNKKILENRCQLNIEECLKIIQKATNKGDLKIDHIAPFVLTWFPTHKKWPYQYYIPSPMLSNTPVGGIVVGTKEPIDEKELLYLEDIALKVTVNINFLEHKEKILQHSRLTAISAIMGRNMSHNIGSHVLSSLDEKSLNHIKQVANFHSYLQKRMDLLARIVGRKPDWGEPLYFVNDLLRGFFSQALLLNHIVKDQGTWEKGSIKFHIKLPYSDTKTVIKFKYVETFPINGKTEDIYSWMPENDASYNDFLVSIPDGIIGAQAFYIFMESMMRNSAKYGKDKNSNKEFIIYIEVYEDEVNKNYYKLKIWDNLSTCDGKLVKDIQDKIKEALIDKETGELGTSSLGIAEMREVCDFLIYPYKRKFPAHEDKVNKEFYPLWAECPGVKNEEGVCNHLCYTFNLAKPKMVAIVNNKIDLPNNADKYGIKKVKKEELLTGEGAFQFVLFYVNDSSKQGILDFISKEEAHRKLPQRLLLVEDNKNKDIPEKRIVFCRKENIKIADLSKNENCEDFIISVYETWVKNKWLKEKTAKLVFNFERPEGDNIWKRWGIDVSGKIRLSEINLLDHQVKIEVWQTNQGIPNRKFPYVETNNNSVELFIIYDNHGKYKKNEIKENNNNKIFWQIIGDKNKKIFETLSTPPQNVFGFKYFLLGFVEAALTRVVIIDERVADASCEIIPTEHIKNCDHMESLNYAHCYSIFAVGTNKKEDKPLTNNLKDKYNLVKEKGKNFCYLLRWNVNNPSFCDYNLCPDFIILHNGIAETVIKELEISNWVKSLYRIAPSIIITSGRGNIIKDDLKGLPFIEFSMIKDNTFPSISKYHLVRSLMSTKGS